MTRPVRFTSRGLRVLYQHTTGPLSAIALSIRAGSRFDGDHPGIAHMAEHMLFQGTTSLDQVALNRRAAELGGEHNADTGHETISLTFEVFNEDVPDALALLADQYYRSEIQEGRFRKERRVVLDEIRGRVDDPVDRLHERAWASFLGGELGRPVWGSPASLRKMTPTDVSNFLRRHFTHDRTILSVVGGVTQATVREAVRREFRHDPGAAGIALPPVVPGTAGRLRVRGDGGQAWLLHLLEVPAEPRLLLAVGMALDLVGSDPDSRLFQEVRERLGLGYEVSATLDWGPDWAVATLAASSARGELRRLEKAVLDVCREAAEKGFSDDEIQRVRKKLRYRYASLAESRLDRALAYAEGGLSGFLLPQEAERVVAKFKRAEVEEAWRRVLAGRQLTAVLS